MIDASVVKLKMIFFYSETCLQSTTLDKLYNESGFDIYNF